MCAEPYWLSDILRRVSRFAAAGTNELVKPEVAAVVISLAWTRVQKPPQNDIHMTRHCSSLMSTCIAENLSNRRLNLGGIILISRKKNSHIPEWIQRARLNSYRYPPSSLSPHNYCYQALGGSLRRVYNTTACATIPK